MPSVLRYLPVGALMLGVAACDQEQQPQAVASATPTPSPTPDSPDPVSIIRPDIEEAPTVPLDPLDTTIAFGSTGTDLSPQAVSQMQDLLNSPQLARGQAVTIRGHSDSSGRDALNMKLSRQRAVAVRDWLVDHGVAADRLKVIAFGAQNPVKPNALPDGTPNEQGRAANRRVEVHVAVPEGATMTAEEAKAAQDRDATRPPATSAPAPTESPTKGKTETAAKASSRT